MHDEEEMSEEEIQKQLEKEEFYKMRRAVQQLKSTGELERYNSLRARERNEEQRIEE